MGVGDGWASYQGVGETCTQIIGFGSSKVENLLFSYPTRLSYRN